MNPNQTNQLPATLKASGPPLWRLQLIRALQVIGVAGGFLGGAQFLQLVAILPPGVASWLLIAGPAFAGAAKPLIMLIGDYADDGIKNDSFRFPVWLFLIAPLGALLTAGGLVSCASVPGLAGVSLSIDPDGTAFATYTATNGQKFKAGPQIGADGKIAAYVTEWKTPEGVTVRARRAVKGGQTTFAYKDPSGAWLAWDSKAGLSIGAIPTTGA